MRGSSFSFYSWKLAFLSFEAILPTTLQKVTVQTYFFSLPAAEKMILKNEAVQETSALAQSLQVNSIHVVAI